MLQPGTKIRIKRLTEGRPVVTSGVFLENYIEHNSPLQNWFAGTQSGQFPLQRIRLRLDDGSITDIVVTPEMKVDL